MEGQPDLSAEHDHGAETDNVGLPAPPLPTPRTSQDTPDPATTVEPQVKPNPLAGYTEGVRQLPVREQQRALLLALSERGSVGPEAISKLERIVSESDWLSFGNPQVSSPAMTRAQCRERRQNTKLIPGDPACGAPNMIVLQGPGNSQSGQRQAPRVCIDQFEFPNLECEYPIVWVRSSEAQRICQALGKRLCDAHEWEGGCAGEVLSVESEYPWSRMPKGLKTSPSRDRRLWLEYEHNRTRELRWAYGREQDQARCGTGAQKDQRCNVVDWGTCGTHSYPAGSFPQCVSPLGVYDQHGNAAEHMNLPLEPKELASRGGLGWTEMKGSWFIFSHQPTHPDDCRWRAKSWHTTRVGSPHSHRNYHLGFRCCKDIVAPPLPAP
jgi:formylglycine-generating enzyme